MKLCGGGEKLPIPAAGCLPLKIVVYSRVRQVCATVSHQYPHNQSIARQCYVVAMAWAEQAVRKEGMLGHSIDGRVR